MGGADPTPQWVQINRRLCQSFSLNLYHLHFRDGIPHPHQPKVQQIRTVNLCKKPVAFRYLEAKRSTLQPRRMASTHAAWPRRMGHGLDASSSTLTEHGVTVPTLCTHPLDTSTLASSTLQPRRGLDVGSTLGSMRPRRLDASAGLWPYSYISNPNRIGNVAIGNCVSLTNV